MALTVNPVLVLTNSVLADYTYVYAILFDKATGYPVHATTGVAADNTTWANAGLFLTKHATFLKWDMKVPVNLPTGWYVVQLFGSSDATADNADSLLDLSFEIDWTGSEVEQVQY